MRSAAVKRALDLVMAGTGLLLLAPVLLLTAIAVRFYLGSPVFFRQRRPGRNGKPFEMFKFRTMTDGRDERGNPLPDAQRLPPFGKFLRSTSLDELPELLNVLRGEMSIVGPRPLLMHYLELYTPEQMRRHEALPGITGLAQVRGRNALSWRRRFRLDAWYARHWSIGLDCRILLLTVSSVLKRDGISAAGHVTVPEFTGREKCRAGGKEFPRVGVAVLGAGGHAKVVIATLQAAGLPVTGVYDDDPGKVGTLLLGVPVLGALSLLLEQQGKFDAVIGIGDNRTRAGIAERFARSGVRWINAVHPSATVHESAKLGAGTVVFAAAVIQPDVVLGTHAIVNTGSSVDHDCFVGNFAHLAPGSRLSGGVRVGDGTLLGIGVVAIPGVEIGPWSIVGAGAAVIRNLSSGVTAVGTPATVIETKRKSA